MCSARVPNNLQSESLIHVYHLYYYFCTLHILWLVFFFYFFSLSRFLNLAIRFFSFIFCLLHMFTFWTIVYRCCSFCTLFQRAIFHRGVLFFNVHFDLEWVRSIFSQYFSCCFCVLQENVTYRTKVKCYGNPCSYDDDGYQNLCIIVLYELCCCCLPAFLSGDWCNYTVIQLTYVTIVCVT